MPKKPSNQKIGTIALIALLIISGGVCVYMLAGSGGGGGIYGLCIFYDINQSFRSQFGEENITFLRNTCLNGGGEWHEGKSVLACDYKMAVTGDCNAPNVLDYEDHCNSLFARWECNLSTGYVGCDCLYRNVSSTTTTTQPDTIYCEDVDDVEYTDMDTCQNYLCPDPDNECKWQPHADNPDIGDCACTDECGWYWVNGMEICYGDCDNEYEICDERWDIAHGEYICSCISTATTTTTTMAATTTTPTTTTTTTTIALSCYDSDYNPGYDMYTSGWCSDSGGTVYDFCQNANQVRELTCSPPGSDNAPCMYWTVTCPNGCDIANGKCYP